jgi:predicted acylesterase/phospholipase RssA
MAEEAQSDDQKPRSIESIAVSLSGGGVRAVGFHLGLLEMLDSLGLLRKVKILSTVSGGSLTGTGYALAQQLGHSFDQYFHTFYDFLPNLNTLEQLMDGLSSDTPPSPSGCRDMIAVMANIYDNEFFRKYFGEGESPRFKVLLDDYSESSHLKEIIFNATEFQTGNAFRFQRSSSRCLIGNGNIYLCEKHAREIRMADIMAASSCIPAGMEPMFFPDDFHWPGDELVAGKDRPMCNEIKNSLRENLKMKFRLHRNPPVDYFALMDGGVYDNQGIIGLILAMNRLKHPKESKPYDGCVCGKSIYEDGDPPGPDHWAKWFSGKDVQVAGDSDEDLDENFEDAVDLIIISDTPVRKDSLYPKLGDTATQVVPMPAHDLNREKRWTDQLTVGGVDRAGWFVTALLLVSAGVTFYQEVWPVKDWIGSDPITLADDILQVGIPFLLTIGLAMVLLRIRKWLRGIADSIYALIPRSRWSARKPWSYIKGMRVNDLINMLKLRIGSVSALTASIFMNRIRSLSYSAAYTRENVGGHIIANQIFALEKTAKGQLTEWPDGMSEFAKPLSAESSAIVALAAHMPTKLWINELHAPAAGHGGEPGLTGRLENAARCLADLNAIRNEKGLKPLNDLDVLVISGQLTICHKLMAHLWERYASAQGHWSNPEQEKIFHNACDKWNDIAENPTLQIDQRKRSAGVPVNADRE